MGPDIARRHLCSGDAPCLGAPGLRPPRVGDGAPVRPARRPPPVRTPDPGCEARTNMARGRESFEKRARELKRQQRATAKRERREERSEIDEEAPVVDEEALMAKYGRLSEQREAGEIDEATFEQERLAIFVELGLVPAGE